MYFDSILCQLSKRIIKLQCMVKSVLNTILGALKKRMGFACLSRD